MKKNLIPVGCNLVIIISFFLKWFKVNLLFEAFNISAYELITGINDVLSIIQNFGGQQIEEAGYVYLYWLIVILPAIAIALYFVGNKKLYRNVSIGGYIVNLVLIFGPAIYLYAKANSAMNAITKVIQLQVGLILTIFASLIGLIFMFQIKKVSLEQDVGVDVDPADLGNKGAVLFSPPPSDIETSDAKQISEAKIKIKKSCDNVRGIIMQLKAIQWGYIAIGVYAFIMSIASVRENSHEGALYGVITIALVALTYRFVPSEVSIADMDHFFHDAKNFLGQFAPVKKSSEHGQNLLIVCLAVFLMDTLLEPHGIGIVVLNVLYSLSFFLYAFALVLLISKGESNAVLTALTGVILIEILGLGFSNVDYSIWFMKILKVLLLWVPINYVYAYRKQLVS